ncbi:response regulator [candidate division LCP-89 bacterium B3_LCP]|uniref:Response regulator n=1 Tax=candidate division LCP-89 bacterium B3_LCP TaxID=2012998 RepID=A0A532UNT9_UNCL8|nr:MAG: response regulator [candidate division LCP-89 bacterium B3_LCP]
MKLKIRRYIVANPEKKTILIVDDEPDVLKYLTTYLEDNGFATISAVDGRDGFQKAKESLPDLITLDITMPEESGVRMFRNLQDDEKLRNIPVVIITGISSEFEHFIKTRKQVDPPTAYFEKPIDRSELLGKIKEILKMI